MYPTPMAQSTARLTRIVNVAISNILLFDQFTLTSFFLVRVVGVFQTSSRPLVFLHYQWSAYP